MTIGIDGLDFDMSGYPGGFGGVVPGSDGWGGPAATSSGPGGDSASRSNGYDANGLWGWTDELGDNHSLPFGWTGTMQGGLPVASSAGVAPSRTGAGRFAAGFLDLLFGAAPIVGKAVTAGSAVSSLVGGRTVGQVVVDTIAGDGRGGTATSGGRSSAPDTGDTDTPSTPTDSGPTIGDNRSPAPPIIQPPALTPAPTPRPQAPAPVPEPPALPESPIPPPAQAAQEQAVELERVERQAKEEERRRRAALRAYLNPTGPSGLRAKPLVGRPRLLGD